MEATTVILQFKQRASDTINNLLKNSLAKSERKHGSLRDAVIKLILADFAMEAEDIVLMLL